MRPLFVSSWLAFALALLPLATHAQPPAPEKVRWTLPPAVQLGYELQGNIKGISYSASSLLKWQAEGGRYTLRLDTRLPLIGTRSQVSEGQITSTGLSPDRYTEQMRKANTATVARADSQVTFNTGRPAAEWHAGAQDRLSVMLQIGQWLRAQPQRYKKGDVIDVQVIGPRNAPIWHFQVDGKDSVALPSGTVEALKFTRLPRDGKPDDDQVIEFWLAPAYQYLPVRLRWSEDGDEADQLLSQISGL
ncbi:MAG: DUF3108 domain-containing protein [Comamonas sp.]